MFKMFTISNLEEAEVARHDEEHHHHEDHQEEAEEAHQHRLEEHHQRLAAQDLEIIGVHLKHNRYCLALFMSCLDLYFEGLSGGFEPLHGGVVRFEPVHRVYNTGTRDPCQAGEARHQHWSPENWLAAAAAAPPQTPAHIRHSGGLVSRCMTSPHLMRQITAPSLGLGLSTLFKFLLA